MRSEIRRYYRMLRELIRLRFQNLMMFRLGFFGPFFVDGSLFAVQLLAFGAVYANVEQIGTWKKGPMILFIGTFSLINAVNMVVYFFGVSGITGKIRSGELDLYLTKPVSPLFRITFEKINPGSIPLVLLSCLILVYGVRVSEVSMTVGRVLSYSFWVLLMMLLFYDMEVLVRSIAFFLISTVKIEQLENAGLELCMKLPGTVFYGAYKVFFYCIMPYGIMATFPVQRMIGEMTVCMGVYGIAVVCGFTILTGVLWKQGIKRYNSASS